MNCAQISVLKHVDEVRLYSLVNCISCTCSKSKVWIEGSDLLSDSSDERSLLSESLVLVLLVLLDLSNSDSSRSVSDFLLLIASLFSILALHAFHL